MDHSLVIILLLLLNLTIGIIEIHDKQFIRTGIKKLKDCLEKRKCSLSDKSNAPIKDRKIDLVDKDLIRNTTALAKGGKAFAQCLLGKIFQNGMGVTPDKDQAIHWYEKAALQGHSEAQYLLAQCILESGGNPPGIHDVESLLRLSASGGSAEAQVELADMLTRLDRTPEDKLESWKWYEKAARQGHIKARRQLEMLS